MANVDDFKVSAKRLDPKATRQPIEAFNIEGQGGVTSALC